MSPPVGVAGRAPLRQTVLSLVACEICEGTVHIDF